MRNLLFVAIVGIFLLPGCNNAKKPSDANFTAAINQYLAKHGQTCALVGREFPVDVPRSAPSDTSGIGARMTALEGAGLVSETDTTAVVHGMLDALRGPARAQSKRRYQLTADGQKSFEHVPDVVGSTGGFCYGQKTVDRIVNWAQPESGSSQAEVTYTYRIVNLASWADRSDVQKAFPGIPATIGGASRSNQIIGLLLTNKGWSVPGS